MLTWRCFMSVKFIHLDFYFRNYFFTRADFSFDWLFFIKSIWWNQTKILNIKRWVSFRCCYGKKNERNLKNILWTHANFMDPRNTRHFFDLRQNFTDSRYPRHSRYLADSWKPKPELLIHFIKKRSNKNTNPERY